MFTMKVEVTHICLLIHGVGHESICDSLNPMQTLQNHYLWRKKAGDMPLTSLCEEGL